MELIEREQQLKKLNDVWSQVKARKGCIALVTGEAGIGKTSLIERFVSEQRRSGRVLWGACDDMFSPQPLGPFLDIALQLPSDLLQQIQSGADRLTSPPNSSSICRKTQLLRSSSSKICTGRMRQRWM